MAIPGKSLHFPGGEEVDVGRSADQAIWQVLADDSVEVHLSGGEEKVSLREDEGGNREGRLRAWFTSRSRN